MTLYLNMVYYPIYISLESCNLTTIFTGFGIFRYNKVPMGICASGGIFQAKSDDIIGYIEVSRCISMI